MDKILEAAEVFINNWEAITASIAGIAFSIIGSLKMVLFIKNRKEEAISMVSEIFSNNDKIDDAITILKEELKALKTEILAAKDSRSKEMLAFLMAKKKRLIQKIKELENEKQ